MEDARIGVVSDTHGKPGDAVFDLFNGQWSEARLARALAAQAKVSYSAEGAALIEAVDPPAPISARACDLIVHAGDIGPQSVLDELGAIARTVAVLGNNDHDRFWCSDDDAPLFRSLSFGGVTLAVAHKPTDLEASLRGAPSLRPKLVEAEPDLAIHGHTHVPRLEAKGHRITLCPGSPARSRNGSGHTVALVDLAGGRLGTVSLVRV